MGAKEHGRVPYMTYEKVGGQLVDHGWTQHGSGESGRRDRAPERFSATPIQSVIRLDRRSLKKTIDAQGTIIFYLETDIKQDHNQKPQDIGYYAHERPEPTQFLMFLRAPHIPSSYDLRRHPHKKQYTVPLAL